MSKLSFNSISNDIFVVNSASDERDEIIVRNRIKRQFRHSVSPFTLRC